MKNAPFMLKKTLFQLKCCERKNNVLAGKKETEPAASWSAEGHRRRVEPTQASDGSERPKPKDFVIIITRPRSVQQETLKLLFLFKKNIYASTRFFSEKRKNCYVNGTPNPQLRTSRY